MAINLKICAYICGLLIFGCLNTLTTKIQFTMESTGIQGETKLFAKPEFGTFAMFVGMTVVLLAHYIGQAMQSRSKQKRKVMLSTPLIGDPDYQSVDTGVSERKAFLYIGIPAVLDLVASIMTFVGLLYVSASIWQMLRGSMIIFSSIESVLFLGRVMKTQHIIGVLLCCGGIACVGLASYIATLDNLKNVSSATMTADADDASSSSADAPEVSTADAMFGMAIVLAGQVVQASQVVSEEVLMKQVRLPPLQIVGFEGLWGVLVMIFIIFPVCYFVPGQDAGSFESLPDTLTMLSNSKDLCYLVLLYIFSCGTYNISGMLVTSSLSAVHRTMLEASRTLVIWLVDLCVFYLIDPKIRFGESWNAGSWVQLLGFVFIVTGQSIYGEILKIPCGKYEMPVEMFHSPLAQLRSLHSLPATLPPLSQ